jgi:hypothetical protein
VAPHTTFPAVARLPQTLNVFPSLLNHPFFMIDDKVVHTLSPLPQPWALGSSLNRQGFRLIVFFILYSFLNEPLSPHSRDPFTLAHDFPLPHILWVAQEKNVGPFQVFFYSF